MRHGSRPSSRRRVWRSSSYRCLPARFVTQRLSKQTICAQCEICRSPVLSAYSVMARQCSCVQARASKLSFTDVVKRLAAQPDSAPTFIAKQVRALHPRCNTLLVLHPDGAVEGYMNDLHAYHSWQDSRPRCTFVS